MSGSPGSKPQAVGSAGPDQPEPPAERLDDSVGAEGWRRRAVVPLAAFLVLAVVMWAYLLFLLLAG